MKNNSFNIGDKVIHVNHGSGIIKDFTEDTTSVIVKFDKEIKGWGVDELEVSVACLKKLS